MHVCESVEQLAEVEATLSLREAPTESDQVKELPSSHKLQHDVLDHLGAFSGVNLLSLAHFDKVNNVLMLQVFKNAQFVLNTLLEVLAWTHELDSEASA